MDKILKKKLKVFNLNFIEPIELFKKFETYKELVFLDSAGTEETTNRYSYLAVDPLCTFKVKKNKIFINNKEKRGSLKKHLQKALSVCNHKKVKGLPSFQCGLSGYVSYDYCLNIEKIQPIDNKKNNFPDLNIGLFDLVFAFDLKIKKAFLFSINLDDTKYALGKKIHNLRRKKLLSLYKIPYITHSTVYKSRIKWKSEISKNDYKGKVKKIIKYINDGDIFQANFTHKFIAYKPYNLSEYVFYLNFRKKTQTPFSAFVHLGKTFICSFSPERFLKVNNLKVTTTPIKGTIKTNLNKEIDSQLKKDLQKSEKNLAENLMIVDVLRNDISRVCKKGSVKVKELAELKSYENVHHLVSTITGKLRKSSDVINLLISCLPGGSVTGAPKIRAMEIISELEHSNRGVYCGAIGYISFNGEADFNIPIRTVTFFDNFISLNCGGGIVADSDVQEEYQESIDKISNILQIKNVRKNVTKQNVLNK